MPSPDTPQPPQGDPCAPEEYAKASEAVALWCGWTTTDGGYYWIPPGTTKRRYNPPDPLHSPADAWALENVMLERGYFLSAYKFPEGISVVVSKTGKCFGGPCKTRSESTFRAAHAAMLAEKEAKANG